MIEKSSTEDEPHAHFDQHLSDAHRLLFQKGEKPIGDEHESILMNYLGCKVDIPGKLILTDFRCIFVVSKQTLYHDTSIRFDFPIGYIAKCESSSQTVNKALVFYLQLATKFGFILKLKSSNANIFQASEHINSVLSEYDSFGEKRAGNLPANQKCNKWEYFFNNQMTLEEAANYDNEAWKFLPTYPQIFKVPKPFVGKRNQNDRIVLLAYVHEGKKSVGLWKSGPGKPDPQEQKWIPSAIKKEDHIVVEIKNKIIGTNKSLAEQMIEMDSPINLRQSFTKFFIATCYQNEQQQQQQRWLYHVNNSKWYEQIEVLLSQSFLILEKICQGVNVTILSEWDARGSQISALVQVLAKPENRTISGFGKLIEREFLHFGHYISPLAKRQRSEDKGIALIQFLDCVIQIKRMFPLSFQFNEDMLAYIVTHIYSRKYGNFLYLTRATTELNQQKFSRYACIWSKIENFRAQFINPFFVDHKECDIYELKRNVGMRNYGVWGSLFFRDILMYGNNIQTNKTNQNYRTINKRHYDTKTQAQVLRQKITEQHRLINEKKKRLKELQQMQLD